MKRTNLIKERKNKGLTQTATAQQIGLATRQYKNLEAGTSDGSLSVWRKLKDLFHKPIDYLLEQDNKSISEKESEGEDDKK